MNPGDIFVFNDPYGAGGQHLPDIYVIKPILRGGALQGYAATMAHHCDVGGHHAGQRGDARHRDLPGRAAAADRQALRGGPAEQHGLAHHRCATRGMPVQVDGDLKAQVAACTAGERGLLELLDRYGEAETCAYFEALQTRAERHDARRDRRAAGRGIQLHRLSSTALARPPSRSASSVRLTIRGDEIEVDLDGTSPQVQAAINCPIAMVNSAAYCAIRCIGGPDIPNCDGYMRPIHVKAPSGTIVNPVLPAACAARGVIGYRVFDTIMGALAQVVPERVIAGCEGGPTLLSIGGWRDGKPFVLTEVMVGTWGARAGRDGPEGISNPAANLSNQPIELIEAELPLEVGAVRSGAGFRRARAVSRRPRLHPRIPTAGRGGDLHSAFGPAHPSALWHCRRRTRQAVDEPVLLRWRDSGFCPRCRWRV